MIQRSWLFVQLLFALPAAYQVFFPRLGPLDWAMFHLVAGMIRMMGAVLFVPANLGLLVAARQAHRSIALPFLCVAGWSLLTLCSWTWTRQSIARQLEEAKTVAASRLNCAPTQADYYERGAEIYCRPVSPRAKEELLRVWVSNGPLPGSPWQVEVGQRVIAGRWTQD
jgi:hypothetical protein